MAIEVGTSFLNHAATPFSRVWGRAWHLIGSTTPEKVIRRVSNLSQCLVKSEVLSYGFTDKSSNFLWGTTTRTSVVKGKLLGSANELS